MLGRNLLLAIIAINAWSQSGCTLLQNRGTAADCCPKKCRRTASAPGAVLVGGRINSPGSLPIPDIGMTLSQAIILAGGRQNQPPLILTAAPASSQTQPADAFTTIRASIAQISKVLGPLDPENPFHRAGTIDDSNAIKAVLDSLSGTVQTLTASGRQDIAKAFTDLTSAFNEFSKSPEDPLKTKTLTEKTAALRVLDGIMKPASALPQVPVTTAASPTASTASPPVQLVSLTRGKGLAATSYFFPAEFAETGIAREISLQDGDLIRVLNFEETSLPQVPSGGGATVQGFIRSAGVQTSPQPFTKLLNGPQIDLNADQALVTLERIGANGSGRELYVMPFKTASGSTYSAQSQTGAGDVLSVLPSFQVPILVDALTSSLRQPNITSVARTARPQLQNGVANLLSGRTQKSASVRPVIPVSF